MTILTIEELEYTATPMSDVLCAQEREEVAGPRQVDPVADDGALYHVALRDAQEGIPAVARLHHPQPGA